MKYKKTFFLFTYHNHVRLISHFSHFCHVSHLLMNEGALEHNEHNKREDTVIPELIEAPQSDAEHLKHEERCDCSFFEQLPKLGNHHVQSVSEINRLSTPIHCTKTKKKNVHPRKKMSILVLSIFFLGIRDILLLVIALPVAICLYRLIDWKLEAAKLLLVRVPAVLGLLKDKPRLLVLVAVQLDEFGAPVIGCRNDFYNRGLVRISRL